MKTTQEQIAFHQSEVKRLQKLEKEEERKRHEKYIGKYFMDSPCVVFRINKFEFCYHDFDDYERAEFNCTLIEIDTTGNKLPKISTSTTILVDFERVKECSEQEFKEILTLAIKNINDYLESTLQQNETN
jgi:hypothetical protein